MTDALAADAATDGDGVKELDVTAADAGQDVDTGAKDDAAVAKGAADDKSLAEDEKAASDASAASADDADKSDDKDADKSAPADIPENWRDLAADGDDDTLKLLKRYGSLKGVAKALKEAQQTIRSGKLLPAMPDPKDEKAVAEWRKTQGIPDDPTGYKIPEPVAKRLSDDDKPLITGFTEFAHSKNARPDVVEIATEWYADMAEKIAADEIAADTGAKEEAEEALRASWGNGEYKGRLALADRWIKEIPGLEAGLDKVRGPDGRVLGANPSFVEWASDMGYAKYGDTSFINSDAEARHTSRRAEIEKIRNTDFDRYEREGLDKELTGLIDKDLKRGKR